MPRLGSLLSTDTVELAAGGTQALGTILSTTAIVTDAGNVALGQVTSATSRADWTSGGGGGTPDPLSHAALLAERTGYALSSDNQGAGSDADSTPAKQITVTSAADSGAGTLRSAISSGSRWIRFDASLDGTPITVASALTPAANITIDGRGRDVTIQGNGIYDGSTFQLANDKLILANLKLPGTAAQVANGNADGININGTAPLPDVWMHHLSITGHGDKCVGLPRGGECEISWCDLYKTATVSHGILIGILAYAESNIFVTVHHSRLDGYTDRYPRVGDGAYAHVHNNVIDGWGTYAVKAIRGGRILAQNNWFGTTNTNGRCIEHEEGTNAIGYVRSSGNALNGGSASNNGTLAQVPEPPYSYTLDTADAAMRDKVLAEAGWQAAAFWA